MNRALGAELLHRGGESRELGQGGVLGDGARRVAEAAAIAASAATAAATAAVFSRSVRAAARTLAAT